MNTEILYQFQIDLERCISLLRDVIVYTHDGGTLHPQVQQESAESCNRIYFYPERLYLESRHNYLHFGSDVSDRYNDEVLRMIRNGTEFINKAYVLIDKDFLGKISKKSFSNEYFYGLPFKKGGPYSSVLQEVSTINWMGVFLSSRLYSYYPKETREQRASADRKKENPTIMQMAIIVYFKAAEGIIKLSNPPRQSLKDMNGGSLSLYHAYNDVIKGKYRLDDLEVAIEHLTDFPEAHRKAIDEFKKRNPVT